MKKELLEKIEKISAFAEKSKVNKIIGRKSSKIGIIASGISYLHVLEALEDNGFGYSCFKAWDFFILCPKN